MRFDPLSSRVVASASADGTVIISSCVNPDLDAGSKAGPFGSVDGEEVQIIFKFKPGSWVNTLSFSPSGNSMAYASKSFLSHIFLAHDCTVHFISFSVEEV